MRATSGYRSYKLLFVVTLICLSLYGSEIFGSEPSAYTRAADNLAFGLDRLRWGMTSAEVQLTYPELKFTSMFDSVDGSAWGPSVLSTYQYRFGDCLFDVALNFFHARLASVSVNNKIDGDALSACRAQVRQDFDNRYGPPGPQYPHWEGPVTNISYDYAGYPICPSVAVVCPPPPRIRVPPPPQPLHIAFSDANDVSGAVADGIAHDQQCLSITAAILDEASGDGASEPFIVPPIRNLGCDFYPPVSYRLQEQGTVIVEAHILADGSIAETKNVTPNRSPRLNDTALDLVRKQLVINPAFKDGKPAEVTRQIAIVFTLTHFIHGIP